MRLYLRIEVEPLECVNGVRVLCDVILSDGCPPQRQGGTFHQLFVIGIV